jgi:hypothetical protein
MSTKFLLIFSLGAFCSAFPLYSQQRSAAKSEPSISQQQHFQIIYTEIDPDPTQLGHPAHQVFLLDTQTGRVWHYQPAGFVGQGPKAVEIPELFIPVEIQKGDRTKTLPD